MKNPILYNALQKAYGEVQIHGEGEDIVVTRPINSSPITRQRGIRLSGKDVSGGEYYAVCCPFCGDSRNRLWVSYAFGSWVTLQDIRVQLSKGLALCYNENCLKKYENWRLFTEGLEGNWNPDSAEIEIKHDPDYGDWKKHTVPLPAGYRLDDRHIPKYICDYIRKRGFSIGELAEKWDIRVGMVKFYDNPVLIIPIYQDKGLAFWQARAIGDKMETWSDGKEKPKYYIPAGSKKSWVLFNFDLAKRHKDVVLVEGVFDAMKVGDCGVAMFGKKPSEIQTRLLYTMWSRGRLLWLPDENDPESVKTAVETTEDWNSRKLFEGGAHVVRMPDRDPGDQTREEICNLIREQTGRPLSSATASLR